MNPLERAMKWARSVLMLHPVFVDTETTGLGEGAEVVEIAVVGLEGETIYHSLVCPVEPMGESAAEINGISLDELALAPPWYRVWWELRPILWDRLAVAHNAAFDRRVIEQSCRRAGEEPPACGWECTCEALKAANGGHWPRLSVAAELAGARESTERHRALADAHTVRRIVLALAEREDLLLGGAA
ncbi:MAG: 3'-5' exonuclease [Methylacidiphilaceae bacterium]|nr:3'-5' exonuclease [Candidatus Methylacidiphilaceae bacterium]